MAAPQSLGIYEERVEDAVRVFGFFGDQGPAFSVPFPEETRIERETQPQFGRHAPVVIVIQIQFGSRDGIFRRPFRVRKGPVRVRGEHAGEGDCLLKESIQACLFQPVGGERTETAVHHHADTQETVQVVLDLVDLPVECADQIHDALVCGHAHFLRALRERFLHALQCQVPFFAGQDSVNHVTLLPRSVS